MMMLWIYAAMTALTALEFGLRNRPRGAGQWFALGLIALLWPIVVVMAFYYAAKKVA